MKKYLKRYSDQNPEKFNKDFILGREKDDILETVKDIFKTLEVIDEFKVEEVSISQDESTFGPIKMQHRYYKSVLPSRLDKIHYRVRVTPSEDTELGPIEFGAERKDDEAAKPSENSFIQEGDIYLNKLVDNCFYINEGVRYFLVYQIVDNATYGTEDCVSLKSLLMPITLKQHEVIATPEFNGDPVTLKGFDVLLFAKKVNPVLYFMGKEAYNDLIETPIPEDSNSFTVWTTKKDSALIDRFNEFFGVDFAFSADINDPAFKDRTVFKLLTEKGKDVKGCYVGVPTDKLKAKDKNVMSVLGSLLDIRDETKKKRIVFSYDDLITPWFWINSLAGFFCKNTDYLKRMSKIRTTLISLNRITDSTTRKILKLKDEDKHDTLTIIRYIMRDFDRLQSEDSQDLDNKRLRLHEYQIYPLRAYFSAQLYRIFNSQTRSKLVLSRALSNLSPTFVIKSTITNELLRYYGASNEIDLYTSLLKFSFRGPQSITSSSVSVRQRDLTPTQTGRISLVASSASDPGLSGNLTPFVEVWDGFFKKQD